MEEDQAQQQTQDPAQNTDQDTKVTLSNIFVEPHDFVWAMNKKLRKK